MQTGSITKAKAMMSIVIAFGPAVTLVVVKFAIDPAWMQQLGLPECLVLGSLGALGALFGVVFGIAAHPKEPYGKE